MGIQHKAILVKELAFADLHGRIGDKTSFAPPYPLHKLDEKAQYTANWCQRNLRTLPFNAGERPFYEMRKTLLELIFTLPSDAIIYVKGTEKCKFLNDQLAYFYYCVKPKICEMETELKTPSLLTLRRKFSSVYNWTKCDLHNDNCAFGNVFLLKQWYINEIILKNENLYISQNPLL